MRCMHLIIFPFICWLLENPEPYFGLIAGKCQSFRADFYVVISNYNGFIPIFPHNLCPSLNFWTPHPLICLNIIEYNFVKQRKRLRTD